MNVAQNVSQNEGETPRRSSVNRQRYSAIHSLTPELLSIILQFAQPKTDLETQLKANWKEHDPLTAALVFGSVTRAWRDITIENPLLWSCIVFRRQEYHFFSSPGTWALDLVDLCIQRSKNALLDAIVFLPRECHVHALESRVAASINSLVQRARSFRISRD